MVRIEGEIVIGRPVEVVFDYAADPGNEPQYNPHMVRAEKITPVFRVSRPSRVASGTRFTNRTMCLSTISIRSKPG